MRQDGWVSGLCLSFVALETVVEEGNAIPDIGQQAKGADKQDKGEHEEEEKPGKGVEYIKYHRVDIGGFGWIGKAARDECPWRWLVKRVC